MLNTPTAVKVPYDYLRYAGRMAKREISDQLRARVCEQIEAWARSGESNAAIGRSLEVERATIGAVRNEGVAGLRVAMAVARRLGTSIEELEREARQRPSVAPVRVSESAHPVYGSLPRAHEALVLAKKKEPFFPPGAWEDALATAALITPPYVTPEMLIYAARLAIETRSATELEDGEAARAESEEADREARQIEAQRIVREAATRGEKLDPVMVMNDLRLRNQRAELDAARARDAAHGAANDTSTRPAPKSGPGGKKPKK